MLEEKNKKTFDDFTNLYELSKTLRFELKPVGKTKELLESQRVFQKDAKILENYRIVKKYFDELHKKFVKDALSDPRLDFENYRKAYFAYVKASKGKEKKELEELTKEEKNLRNAIKNLFDACAKSWKEKYDRIGVETKKEDLGMLFEKEIFNILSHEFEVCENPEIEFLNEEGDKRNIFESFKGFTTYFTNFHNSRKNFYKDDGTASAIPTRIIDNNLRKFVENIGAYSHIRNKIKFAEKEKEIFEMVFYNKCFLQEGIDAYNKIIGDINSHVNKYRQDKKEKIPFLKVLFKQILEDINKQETEQDGFIEIGCNDNVFPMLEKFIEHNEKNNEIFEKIFKGIIRNQNDYELDKIYLAGRFINTISGKWFKDWSLFNDLLLENNRKKLDDFISIAVIRDVLKNTKIKNEDLFKKDILDKTAGSAQDAYDIFLRAWEDEFYKNITDYNKYSTEVAAMMSEDIKYTNKKEKVSDKEIEIQKEKIKNLSDSALAIYQMMKYFLLEKGKKKVDMQGNTDNKFYNEYDKAMEGADTWLYYNEFRNYLTKKPFNEDKIKLNFENGTLLDGWDENKEAENFGVILKKDKKYYLGLMLKKSNKIFTDKFKNEIYGGTNNGYYEKMYYKFMADPKKDFPKGCFSKKGIDIYKPSQEIMEIYQEESFKKNNDKFSIDKLHKLIDFYRECLPLHPSWKIFDFRNLKDTDEYNDNIGEFYKDVEKNSWKIWFEKVSEKYINEKVENGELYLFEVYNKDFSKESTGNKNLHTIYFENIFSDENIKNPVIKLNGQAEIFFREKTEDFKSEDIITKKNLIKLQKGKKDLAHKQRYSEDKILFHCPIKLNFTKDDKKINLKVNELLTDNRDVNIIGIDRGEKHLAYYSIIDKNEKIIDIGSLNKINGIDYLQKLDDKEKNINAEQQSWQAIENIKELKAGYISQVIKKICNLAIEHNAIIVFEDLNAGFKQGRQKIKKQIYQKLELALVNKLNYFVKKEMEAGKPGHFLKAYQLAPKIDNFQDIGKQTGIIFYTQAGYTSTTCPQCGFRKNLYLKYSTIEDSQKIFKYLEIFYEAGKNRFSVKYNPKNFKDFESARDEYVVYFDGIRLRWSSSKRITDEHNPNEMLKKLFADYKIDVSGNISPQINGKKFDKDFYSSLIFIINLILQLRNSNSAKDLDYIICPSCGFHSNNGFQGKEFNGDANGAYNIARKGIMILDKIDKFKKNKGDLSKLKWSDLTVKMEEWDKFVQK